MLCSIETDIFLLTKSHSNPFLEPTSIQ